jgi:hypothetical protein
MAWSPHRGGSADKCPKSLQLSVDSRAIMYCWSHIPEHYRVPAAKRHYAEQGELPPLLQWQ